MKIKQFGTDGCPTQQKGEGADTMRCVGFTDFLLFMFS